MAIDPLNEQLILPREATALFPPGPNGRRIPPSGIFPSMGEGARGVVLESLNTPRKCTSKQAVARFLVRLSQRARPELPQGGGVAARVRPDREAEHGPDRLGL